MAKNEKILVLVDGNALVHRGFHALPPTFRTKSGELVNGVFGFTSVLLKVFEELKPEYVVCAFDLAKKTFRHEEYAQYKAKRVSAPQELYDQFTRVKEVVKVLNIPIFEKEGFEADDIIGTICQIEEQDERVDKIIVVTGDLDTLQLVSPKVKVLTLKKGVSETVFYGEKETEERFNLKVSQLVDYKGLRGDPSDNIPGVKGIGEKTAKKLLQKFESIEEIYKSLKDQKEEVESLVGKRVVRLLEEDKKQAFLSKDLGLIRKNVPLNFDLNKAILKDYDQEKAVELFVELGFRSLIKRLPESAGWGKIEKGKKEDQFVREEDVKIFLSEAEEIAEIGLEVLEQAGRIQGVVLGWDHRVIYLDWGKHKEKKDLISFLKSQKVKKVGHDLKRVIKLFRKEDIDLGGIYFDTQIAAYLIDSSRSNYGLEVFSFGELGTQLETLENIDKALKKGGIEKEDLEEYFCRRVFAILKLKKIFKKELKEKKVFKLFFELEMPLVLILSEMELEGITLDVKFLESLKKKMDARVEKIQKKIWELAGGEFNVNSTQQLREVLFEKLKIKATEIKKTKTGFSTAASELEKLVGKHPIIDLLFEYREITKLTNTYVAALPKLVDEDQRLHTNFKQTGTTTGRLSSENPNLQNIPVRTSLGREIRKAFVAKPGFKLVSADYSQIELRIVASLSKDEKMLKVFREGGDIHAATAALVGGVSLEKVTPQMRRAAKSLNFGVIYGMGPYGFSRDAGISREEARDFIKKYMRKFEKLANWIEEIKKQARRDGYVETLMGRRRYLPEINSFNWQVRSAAERMAINAPNQGLAADIIKMAMIEVWNLVDEETRMLLQVHDELVFEVKTEKVKSFASKLKKAMEGVFKLEAPLVVVVKVGENWNDLELVKL
jgi:DNA polymerase-1